MAPAPDHAANPDARPEGRQWWDDVTSRVPTWLAVVALWAVGLSILVGVVLWVLDLVATLLVVTLPLIIAVVLTTLCWPLRARLVDMGLPPAAAAAVTVFGGLAVLIGIFAAIGPGFVAQIQELGPTLLSGRDAVVGWLETGPLGLDAGQLDDILQRAEESLTSGGASSGVLSNILSGVTTVGQFLAGLALLLVLLFFIVKDGDVMVAWANGLLSPRHRPTAAALGSRAWTALSGYVRGTAAIALIDAMGIGLGLVILGVPLVLPLMLLVFFGGFLPVVGAAVAGLVAVLVALADGGIVTAALTLGVVLLVQQIEGNLLHPIIMRRAVALHPVVVLTALGAGAALAGIIGAFLSVPVAAVLAALGNELRLRAQHGHLGTATHADAPSEPLGGSGGLLSVRGESLPAQVAQDNAPGMHPRHDHDDDPDQGEDPVEDRM